MNAHALTLTRAWHTDARPLWLRALESRLIHGRVRCSGQTLKREQCRTPAYFLTASGQPRCGQHRGK